MDRSENNDGSIQIVKGERLTGIDIDTTRVVKFIQLTAYGNRFPRAGICMRLTLLALTFEREKKAYSSQYNCFGIITFVQDYKADYLLIECVSVYV